MLKLLPSFILAAAAWTHAQAPAAPTLAYPSDKGINVATATSLKWKTVPGATGYEAQVASEPTFAAPVLDDSTLTDTLFHVSHLADTTLYYWRARAKNASGFGPYAKARSFTTTPPLGSGPTLAEPGVAALDVALLPTFKWNTFPDAKAYGLQISTASNFATLLFTDTSIADTVFKLTGAGLVKGTLYYWHVRANTSPVKTAWTKGSFTTVNDAPTDAVVPTAPEDGAVDQPIPAYFSWQGVDRASLYVIQVSPQADFSAAVITDSLADPYGSVDGLIPNTTYYWRVRGASSTGQAPYSAVWHFKTANGTAVIRKAGTQGASMRIFPGAVEQGTDIEFTLGTASQVKIIRYGLMGGQADVLAEGRFAAGTHRISRAGTMSRESGRDGAGIRFIELRAGDIRLVRRVMAP